MKLNKELGIYMLKVYNQIVTQIFSEQRIVSNLILSYNPILMYRSSFLGIFANGCVYETFGISKHCPVKLQELLIRAEMLDNPLTAKCFIYDVGNWCLSISVCLSFI